MSDRLKAIELKRAKLLALRQETQRRREAQEKKETAEAAEICANSIKGGTARQHWEDVDVLLSSLGGALGTGDPVQPEGSPSDSDSPRGHCPSVRGIGSTGNAVRLLAKQKKCVLSVQMQPTTSFPPQELITYCKHTQTSVEVPEESEPPVTFDNPIEPNPEVAAIPAKTVEQAPNESVENIGKPAKHQLTEKEQARLMSSNEFRSFFERSSKLVERALGEKVDIFKDYTEKQSTFMSDAASQNQLLTLNRSFSGNGLDTSIVSSIDWSTQNPELFLASYSLKRTPANKDEGLCLIWNTMYGKETPEYTLECLTEVVASKFAVFHPNLVLGGTYSGQIVLWDTRETRRFPVLKSSLWERAHTQPVFSMNLIGAENAHNLVTTSSDSSVCVWSLDMLTKPQQIIDLSVSGGVTVAPTCVDFPKEETNNFVIGGEEGTIYYASLCGESPGVNHHLIGHEAPISGISAMSACGSHCAANIYLTSSFDWSVKLWSAKEAESLHTFSSYGDVVYDVKWSPTHPAVFATADGNGQLQIWNLSMPRYDCLEVPVATALVEDSPALNKVAWAKTGKQVAVGDDSGRVWVYDVHKKLSSPTEADWASILKTFKVDKPERPDLKEITKGIAKLKTHLTKGERFPR